MIRLQYLYINLQDSNTCTAHSISRDHFQVTTEFQKDISTSLIRIDSNSVHRQDRSCFFVHSELHRVRFTSSQTYLMTAEKGASSGTEMTLQGCSIYEVRMILKVTLLPLLILNKIIYVRQKDVNRVAISPVTDKQDSAKFYQQLISRVDRVKMITLISRIERRSFPKQFIQLFSLYITMASPEVLSEFSDNKMSATITEHNDSKLPKITKPQSRSQASSKAQSRKIPPSLPSLKTNPADPPHSDPKIGSDSERNDFALEIEQKLKLVIQNVNHGGIEEDSEAQSDVDFEELVEQNKEKIKLQKQKAEAKPNHQAKQERKQAKSKSKTMKPFSKNDNSLYERRMKEFREASNENKYILKKKELLAQRQEAIEKAVEKARIARNSRQEPINRVSKEAEDIRQIHKQLPYPQNYNFNSNKIGKSQLPPRSAFKKKLSSKNILKDEENILKVPHQISKTANLFDNIHNLLQNPNKVRAASEMKKCSANNIKALQDKIKQINKKLGLQQTTDLKFNRSEIEQKTVSDWKRIDYNNGNFKCHFDSNFEKEIEKIGTLQQKNNDYLAQLVTHQKTLVQLALIKKIHPNIITNTT